MREYELVIDEALKGGLNSSDDTPTNTQTLTECFGLRLGLSGLEAYKYADNPLLVQLSYSHPFPQYIQGNTYDFLISRSTADQLLYIYTVSDNTPTLITTIDEKVYGLGGLFTLADFGRYIFLTNGLVSIIYDVTSGAFTTMTYSSTIPLIKHVTNFKGQMFGGNVNSSWYDCNSHYYIWSNIGNLNFTINQQNEAGYRICPFGGEVLGVKLLGDSLIGYSSKGIVEITPVIEPTTSFKFSPIQSTGLLNEGALAGDITKHVFISNDHYLYTITNKGISMLGYRQYMTRLIDDKVVISYDKLNKDFYISDGTTAFLLSPKGLTEIPQTPSTVWSDSNNVYMLPDTLSNPLPYLTTAPFDMGYSGQKTTFVVESDAYGFNSAFAIVNIFNQGSWKSLNYQQLNDMGVSTNIASSNLFKFTLNFSDITKEFNISRITVRYKMTDLRSIRGVYAPPIRGQR